MMPLSRSLPWAKPGLRVTRPLLPHRHRPPRRNPAVGPSLHVRVDSVDLLVRQQLRESRHALPRTAGLHRGHERLAALDRTTRPGEFEEIPCDRIAQHVLPVTAGAVDAVLAPALVLLWGHLGR